MKVLILNNEKFEVEENDFSVDRSNIDGDMCSIPKKILDYGIVEAKFRLAVETLKANLTHLEADLDNSIRNQPSEGKKQTEAQIKNEIVRSKEYQQLQSQLLETQNGWNTTRWIMNALDAKKDCLIALAYTDRQLMKVGQF